MTPPDAQGLEGEDREWAAKVAHILRGSFVNEPILTDDEMEREFSAILEKRIPERTQALRSRVEALEGALRNIVQGEDGDKAHRAIAVARQALSAPQARGEDGKREEIPA